MAAAVLAPTPTGVEPVVWAAACEAVRAFCGWHVAPSVTESVTVDGSGGSVQFLPTLHLTALTSISSDGVEVTDPEWSAAGMVRGACWSRKFRGVTATMTHGYDECPPAVLEVVRNLAASSASAVAGARQITSGPHSVTLTEAAQAGASALSPAHESVLARYRIPSRP